MHKPHHACEVGRNHHEFYVPVEANYKSWFRFLKQMSVNEWDPTRIAIPTVPPDVRFDSTSCGHYGLLELKSTDWEIERFTMGGWPHEEEEMHRWKAMKRISEDFHLLWSVDPFRESDPDSDSSGVEHTSVRMGVAVDEENIVQHRSGFKGSVSVLYVDRQNDRQNREDLSWFISLWDSNEDQYSSILREILDTNSLPPIHEPIRCLVRFSHVDA
jgi:hypothetical protein